MADETTTPNVANLDPSFHPDSPFGRECVEVFQKLIQFDTTNPPGNETPAQEFLAEIARREGFEPEVVESAPGRGNLVIRWEGTDKGAPSVTVAAHMDVVAANPTNWTHPPFSGERVGKYIWGRGALDCKNTVLSEFMAMVRLKREGFRPKGTIILFIEADEEESGHYGVRYMLDKHLEKVGADFAINEGGGFQVPIGKVPQFTIQTSEKGTMWTKLRVYGHAGHGSMQSTVENNALLKMAEIVRNVDAYKKPIVLTRPYLDMVDTLQLPGIVRKLLKSRRLLGFVMKLAARKFGSVAQTFIGSLVRNTFNPTVIRASDKTNIIPDTCEVTYDVRVLPGFGREEIDAEFRKMVGPKYADEVEVLPVENGEASASPVGTLCWDRLVEALHEIYPGAETMPLFMSGATDNRFFRFRGIPAYGFTLLAIEDDMDFDEVNRMMHGVDERISVTNLMLSVQCMYEFMRLW
ncbi:MAG: M20/M25/M40 family metallo-hydrolase [Promethearchaeota archaeon]